MQGQMHSEVSEVAESSAMPAQKIVFKQASARRAAR